MAKGGGGGGGGGGNAAQQKQGGAAGAGGGGPWAPGAAELGKAQEATRRAQAEARVAKDYAEIMQRKLDARDGKVEPQMDIDDGRQSGKQLTEELAEAEADIKFLQEQGLPH